MIFKKEIQVLNVFLFFVCAGAPVAGAAGNSQDEWGKVLTDIGVKADPVVVNKLIKSEPTIQKIQSQTKGILTFDQWVEIFKKLDVVPKNDMQPDEWAIILHHFGIDVTPGALAVAPPGNVPASAIQSEVLDPPTAVPPQQPLQKPENAEQSVDAKTAEPQQKNSGAPKISLDLRGMDIFSALKIVSSKLNLSIVTANTVKGTVTLYLKDVDAFEALKLMLEMNDLAYVQEGNVIKVLTTRDYEAMYGNKFYDKTGVEVVRLNNAKVDTMVKLTTTAKSKIGQIIADTATNSLIIIDTPENIILLKKLITQLDVKLETQVFALSYVKSKDIADKLKNMLSIGISDIQTDEKNNLVIITDFKEKLEDVSKIITSLDRRHREVLIESKLVSIALNSEFKMGVNWDSVFTKFNETAMPGKLDANFSAIPLGGTGVKLSVGTIEVNNFNAVLDLLKTKGKTNLVSSPRITAIDNEEARILVGTKEAYVTTTVTTGANGLSTTAESVTFVDVGMKLYVTPSIGDDGFVTMKIRPEVSSVDRTISTSQGNTIPIIRSSQAETTIMVKDGVTIVLAGLIEDKKIKSTEGVPLLGSIPIIGRFFSRTNDQTMKTELAIFLTPRIMTGDAPNYDTKDKKSLTYAK